MGMVRNKSPEYERGLMFSSPYGDCTISGKNFEYGARLSSPYGDRIALQADEQGRQSVIVPSRG